jgi:hypothetical protein
MSEFPTRPGDIPYTVALAELAELHAGHRSRLVDHRHGLSEPLTADEFRCHALAVLAYQAALTERAAQGRWVAAVDALAASTDPQDVAAAMGLDVEQLRIGAGMWASGQHREGLISPERYADVLALIGEVTS